MGSTTIFIQPGGTDPRLPADPQDILSSRSVPRPTIFTLAVVGGNLVFTVGNSPTGVNRHPIASYTVFFVSAAFWYPGIFAIVDQVGQFVGSQQSPGNGGSVVIVNSTLFNKPGYFYAIGTDTNGFDSLPTNPIKAPTPGTSTSMAAPPAFTSPTASKATVTPYGYNVTLLTVTAVVPSTNQGILGITMSNNGSGYTSIPTVTFSGGLATGGAAATAAAVVDSGGHVSSVTLLTPGDYTSAPTVGFTGGGGSSAAATAVLGPSTQIAGLQIDITNYFGGSKVEGPFFPIGTTLPGNTLTGQFYLVPDPLHTTTLTFVTVGNNGVFTSGPTTTITV